MPKKTWNKKIDPRFKRPLRRSQMEGHSSTKHTVPDVVEADVSEMRQQSSAALEFMDGVGLMLLVIPVWLRGSGVSC